MADKIDPVVDEKSALNTTAASSEFPRDTNDTSPSSGATTSQKKGYQFWLILLALCVSTLLVAIDLSILSTALPTIAADLSSSSLYVWIINAYVLSSTAVQPLYGQTTSIFGARALTIFAVCTFILGSALCGWANSTPMLIAGRTVQGIGGGGITSMGYIIMCSLTSLRERGKYAGLIAATYAIGTVLGPLLGGAFAQRSHLWRWIFWLNIPLGAIALALVVPFLHLKHSATGTLRSRLARVDVVGNALLSGSVAAMLIPLSTAGTSTPWTSWRTLFPLVLGGVGLLLFAVHQTFGRIAEPTMPPALFRNRTSAAILVMGFLHGLLLISVSFFMPIYMQATRLFSPIHSGLASLPISFSIAPAAAIGGLVTARTGTYRWAPYLGFSIMAITLGCFSLYDTNTPTVQWVLLQFLFGVGCGVMYSTLVPAMLASLESRHANTASAMWGFMRSLGQVWGVALPSAVFNARVDALVVERLGDWPEVGVLLRNGGAYEKATAEFMGGLKERAGLEVQNLVRGVYVDALKVVWWAVVPWAVIGVVLAFAIKSYELSKTMEEDVGIDETRGRNKEVVVGNSV
jgi:MFS family permease